MKWTAILPLYFASVIMLAFAVFPHHHHHTFICFNSTECTETTTEEHHDHGPYAGESCVKHLFQTEVTRSLSLNDTCSDGHCHHFITPFFLSTDIFQLLSSEIVNEVLPGNPYRERLYSAIYTADITGRAPPAKS